MNYEALKSRMDEYLATSSVEDIIREFEREGYEFSDYIPVTVKENEEIVFGLLDSFYSEQVDTFVYSDKNEMNGQMSLAA